MLQRKYNFQHFLKKILCFHNRTIYYKFKVDLEEIRNETLNNTSLHTISVLASPAIAIAGVSSPPVSSISDVNNIKNMNAPDTINNSNSEIVKHVKHDDNLPKCKSNDDSSGYVLQIEAQ